MSADASPRVLLLFTEVRANGGIQRFNQTVLEACRRLGLGGVVLSLHDSAQALAKYSESGRLEALGFSGDRRRFMLAIARTLSAGRFDRVLIGHVNYLTVVAALLALSPRRHGPAMLIAHGIEVWNGLGWGRRLALARMNAILCVSRYTRQRILEQAPTLQSDRLLLFPNALAPGWGEDLPLPPQPGLPARFILSVTRLEPGDRYKGIATVIEAFSMQADQDMHYVVVGKGQDMPFLRLVSERCGVKDRVHFLSHIDDAELVSLYQHCIAFLLPSGKEGFGIVYLEAMFFGAPVVAAREKGAVDVVRDGETGMTVRFGDVIALKEAIERLGSDQPLRERLCSGARTLVSAGGPFTFAAFTRRLGAAFQVAAAHS
jgi:glycosyltransferase involved in cell wall biosynthesis